MSIARQFGYGQTFVARLPKATNHKVTVARGYAPTAADNELAALREQVSILKETLVLRDAEIVGLKASVSVTRNESVTPVTERNAGAERQKRYRDRKREGKL